MIKFTVVIFLLHVIFACSPVIDKQSYAPDIYLIISDRTENYQQVLHNNNEYLLSVSPHAEKFKCIDCHYTYIEFLNEEIFQKENTTQLAEILSRSSELCLNCHFDKSQKKLYDQITILAHNDFECMTCHDPHNAKASCTQSFCHVGIRDVQYELTKIPPYHPTTGYNDSCGNACHKNSELKDLGEIHHQQVHVDIPCFVCHDVSGLSVTMNKAGYWYTIKESSLNTIANEYIVSHQIGREVSCIKCHYVNNPWKLNLLFENN